MKYVLTFFFLILIISCNSSKRLNGSYYNTCYMLHAPSNVIKIIDGKFELYSPAISGEKYSGKSEMNGGMLYLYIAHDIINNFKDTIAKVDTLKYVIKGRKLIPFKNEKCFYKKTKDKSKLFQLPYKEIDTTRG